MNKKGKLAVQILIILVVVVATSAVIFLLVQQGVIEVKEMEGASVLNLEFIPYRREGYLVVKEFQFCEGVGVDYECVGESKLFNKPGLVFFRFIIESTTVDGEVMLVENYRVKGPEGNVLLEVDEKDNFYFDMKSKKGIQEVYFKDYLVMEEEDKEGKYVLELVMENPLLNKKVTLVKEFEIVSGNAYK